MTNLHSEFNRKCENIILGIITGEISILKVCLKLLNAGCLLIIYSIMLNADSRLLHFPPSVIATATLFYVINDIEPSNAVNYLNQLMAVLKVRKVCTLTSSFIFSDRPLWASQQYLIVFDQQYNYAYLICVSLKFFIFKQASIDECHDLILELMGTSGSKICQTNKRKCQSIPGTPGGVIDAYFSCESSNDSLVVASSVSSLPDPQYKRSRTQDQQILFAPISFVSGFRSQFFAELISSRLSNFQW